MIAFMFANGASRKLVDLKQLFLIYWFPEVFPVLSKIAAHPHFEYSLLQFSNIFN
jgi:hypothetical protein